MKIIMFGQKRIPSRDGGIEVAVQELSTRMAARGNRILCYNRAERKSAERKDNEYRGVSLRTVPTIEKKGLAAVSSAFFAALSASMRRCDIVHIHGEGPAFFSFLPKLAGKKTVVTIHGLDWAREKWRGQFASRFIYWGEQMAVKFSDEIIVLSQSAQDYFWKQYHRRTVRIPNGIEQKQGLPANEITQLFGLNKDAYLLFVGRLVPEKGIHHLIRAFRAVQTKKKLVIAGKSSDSDIYVKQLYALAEDDERILFTGFVEGDLLGELYSNCYCYILPSSLEGMPLTLLEAMSYGDCCVVSDIPECCEVVGDDGICIPIENDDALRTCLQHLCNEPALVEIQRRYSLKRSKQHESWDSVTEKTLELYAKILNRGCEGENSADQ